MNILIIEPNKLLAAQYQAYLNVHGHRVMHCQTAEEAVLAADQNMPDVIVAEMYLGLHSAVEFLYELRTYPEWKTIPVLLHSRVSEADSGLDKATLKALGVVQYLYKPATKLSKLADMIESATQRQAT